MHVKMETESEVMLPQPGILYKHQKLGKRPGTSSSLEPQGEHGPADTLILDSQRPELGDNKFLLF